MEKEGGALSDVTRKTTSERTNQSRGKLRIGDDWNAITIIALSQSNPLKAIAEFVENSIDAQARSVTITRGREHGRHYLAIRDDGDGVPRDGEGLPDFRYVATHICDSIKRRLKADGAAGLQGEFGIGLLSFWTVGEELTMTSTGADQRAYQMIMRKGDPSYRVHRKRALFAERGTEVRIAPLLDGIRALVGRKDPVVPRLGAARPHPRRPACASRVVDELARKQYAVEPRQYEGRLLHQLPAVRTPCGDVYAELYLNEPAETNASRCIGAARACSRISRLLDDFARAPWTSRYLQGHRRCAVPQPDAGHAQRHHPRRAYAALCEALQPLEAKLVELIEAQRRAEEEQASREQLRTIQRALPRGAAGAAGRGVRLVRHSRASVSATPTARTAPASAAGSKRVDEVMPGRRSPAPGEERQRQFFEFAGPLFSVAISPASSIVRVGDKRELRALPRDRSRRRVEQDLEFRVAASSKGPGALAGHARSGSDVPGAGASRASRGLRSP